MGKAKSYAKRKSEGEVVVNVWMKPKMLALLDKLVEEQGYASRPEALLEGVVMLARAAKKPAPAQAHADEAPKPKSAPRAQEILTRTAEDLAMKRRAVRVDVVGGPTLAERIRAKGEDRTAVLLATGETLRPPRADERVRP